MSRSRYADNGSRRRKIRARLLAECRPCAICGLPIDTSAQSPSPVSAEVDEIVPVSLGGDPLDRANCQLVHRCCNQWRSNRSMALVMRVRAEMRARGLLYRSPQEFVMEARRVAKSMSARRSKESGAIATSRRW